jgi:hypothetical protein
VALDRLTLAECHAEFPRARPERMLGQYVHATGARADPVHSIIDEQVDMIANTEFVRVARAVQLLRCVRAEGETRTVQLLVRPRRNR